MAKRVNVLLVWLGAMYLGAGASPALVSAEEGRPPATETQRLAGYEDYQKALREKYPARHRALLLALAKKGNLYAAGRMIDLQMFEEMRELDLDALASWPASAAKVEDKTARQILADLRANLAVRIPMRPGEQQKVLAESRAALERDPLENVILIAETAWLHREYEPVDFTQASWLTQRALDLLAASGARGDDPLLALSRARLAAELSEPRPGRPGDAVKAVELYGRVASQSRALDDYEMEAGALSTLIRLHKSQDRSEQVGPLLSRYLLLGKERLTEKNATAPLVLDDLTGLCLDADKAEAERLQQRALAIREKRLGAEHPEVAASLDHLAGLYRSLGRDAEARPLYLRSLAIKEKRLGPDHPEVAVSLKNLALLYEAQGQGAQAQLLYKRARTIEEGPRGQPEPPAAGGTPVRGVAGAGEGGPWQMRIMTLFRRDPEKTPPDPRLKEYWRLDEEYHSLIPKKALGEAAVAAEKAAGLAKDIFGEEHEQYLVTLSNLGNLYLRKGRPAQAERVLLAALRGAAKAPGDPVASAILIALGHAYVCMNAYTNADIFYRRGVENTLGRAGNALEAPSYCAEIAKVWEWRRDLARAQYWYERCLQATETALGPHSEKAGTCLDDLAGVYFTTGEMLKAKSALHRSLEIKEKTLGPEHAETATCLHNLAMCYDAMQLPSQAEPLFLRCLAIREKVLPPGDPATLKCMENLAILYDMNRERTKSAALWQRVLDLIDKHDPDNPEHIHVLSNLANSSPDEAKAEELLRRCVQLAEKRYGPNHVETARAMHEWAQCYVRRGEYPRAVNLMERSLEAMEKARGPNDREVVEFRRSLGQLYWRMGQCEQAETLLRRCLGANGGAIGPDTGEITLDLARICAATGRYPPALSLFQAASHLNRRARHAALLLRSPADPSAGGGSDYDDAFQGCASTLFLGYSGQPAPPAAVEVILNGKGLGLRALMDTARLTLRSADPQTAQLAERLVRIRAEWSALALHSGPPEQEAGQKEQLKRLETQEADLVKQLGWHSLSGPRKDLWVEAGEVASRIPAKTALVEIFQFALDDFKPKVKDKPPGVPRYGALVIPSRASQNPSAPVVLDLGLAEEMDAAIRAFHVSQRAPDADSKLKGIADLLLAPLEKYLRGCNQWLVSPDGQLWLVPWAALPLRNGRLVLEEHTLGYVTCGRDLAEPGFRMETTAPIVVADPDYDLGLAVATAAEQAGPVVSRSRDMGTQRWQRLPGTRREAEGISASLAAYAQAQPRVLLDAGASEEAVKAVRRPKVLVLSTHGFFLEDQGERHSPAQRSDKDGRGIAVAPESVRPPAAEADKRQRASENPLLRCGLVLAGANNREKVGPGGNDGILTGLEIVTLDLRATDLVVLSACDTGVGDVRNGEGVAGLRQCFQLAGTKSVVATLWKIPDEDSARLMTLFFQNLAAGQGKSDALRAAQLALRDERRKAGKPDHPFFWAAFTLTGDWR